MIYTGLHIGDGFNPSFPSLIPAEAASCFDETIDTDWLPGDNRYYAFHAFSGAEARSKFIELAHPAVDDPTLPQTLEDLLNNTADGDTPHLILAVQVDTHKDRMDSNLEAASCNQYGSELDDFVYKCGTQYLHDQTYGGYIFLTTPVTTDTMDLEQYDQINDLIHVYIEKHGKSAADAIADIANVTSAQFEFTWAVWGLPEPRTNPIQAQDWLSYEQHAEHFSNYSYNEVLHQTFKQFTAGLLGTCGLSGDTAVREALECYRELHDITNNPQGNPQITAAIDHMNWVLNSPDNVRLTWGDATNDPLEWLSLYNQMIECIDTDPSISPVSDMKVLCESTMAAGISGITNICTVCQVPSKCDPTMLYNSYTGLPQPVVTPVTSWTPEPRLNVQPVAEAHTVKHNTSQLLRNYSSHLCVLAGMQGKMAGAGESALVDVSSGDWRLTSTSGQGATTNKMTVYARCAERDWFTTSGSPVTSWYTEVQVSKSTTNGQQFVDMDTGAYASALSGIKGKMDNESEYVNIVQSPSTSTLSRLEVGANNYLEGKATTFGVDHNASSVALTSNPASRKADTHDVDTDPSGNTLNIYRIKKRLASTDDTFCYLTHIQGRFDGNGEGVYLTTEGNYWFVVAKAGCEQRDNTPLIAGGYLCADWKRVQATARCYKYDQN